MNKLATRRLVPSQVPPAIHAQLLQIGPVVEPPAAALVYAPLHLQEPYAQVTTGAARPVLVFLHGGALIAGVLSPVR